MAAPHDPLNDPRWAHLDSQSLPGRPAHPDPSRVTEHGSADEVPSHGIVGHLDAKIGLTSDAALRADQARYHQGIVEQLEAERKVAQSRADAGDDAAKANLGALKDSIAHHKGLAKGAQDAELTGGDAVREQILSGNADTVVVSSTSVEDLPEAAAVPEQSS